MMLKENTACLCYFKTKNKKQKYLLDNKKKHIKKFPFISIIFKKYFNLRKNSVTTFFKNLIKYYFFSLKYIKLLRFNNKKNKFNYSANFNKLKNKIVISKFPTIKKQQPKKKIPYSAYLKKTYIFIGFLFNFFIIKSFIDNRNMKLNNIYIFSNFFLILTNMIENHMHS